MDKYTYMRDDVLRSRFIYTIYNTMHEIQTTENANLENNIFDIVCICSVNKINYF